MSEQIEARASQLFNAWLRGMTSSACVRSIEDMHKVYAASLRQAESEAETPCGYDFNGDACVYRDGHAGHHRPERD